MQRIEESKKRIDVKELVGKSGERPVVGLRQSQIQGDIGEDVQEADGKKQRDGVFPSKHAIRVIDPGQRDEKKRQDERRATVRARRYGGGDGDKQDGLDVQPKAFDFEKVECQPQPEKRSELR